MRRIEGCAQRRCERGIRAGILVLLTILLLSGTAEAWWNTSYYRVPILLNNTGNATDLIFYQVPLIIYYNSTGMDANFTTLHIVNETSGSEEPFWIESQINSSSVKIWINLSKIPASVWTNTTYYLYFRNATEDSASNGTNTFSFFDDFEDGIYTDKWEIDTDTASGTFTEANGYMEISNTAGGFKKLRIKSMNFSQSTAINLQVNGVASTQGQTVAGWSASQITGYKANVGGVIFHRIEPTDYDTGVITTANTWYNLQIIASNGNNNIKIDTVNLNDTRAYTLSNSNFTIGLVSGTGTGTHRFDNIRVKNHISPEPTANLNMTTTLVKVINLNDAYPAESTPIVQTCTPKYNLTYTDTIPSGFNQSFLAIKGLTSREQLDNQSNGVQADDLYVLFRDGVFVLNVKLSATTNTCYTPTIIAPAVVEITASLSSLKGASATFNVKLIDSQGTWFSSTSGAIYFFEYIILLEAPAQSISLSCSIGWCYAASNYSSITLLQFDNNFSTDTIQGRYNATSQKYESHRTNYSFNQNVSIAQKEGYYIYFSAAQDITTTPGSTPSITLKTGWNLVGNYGSSARTLSALKSSIGAPATQAKYYDKTLKTWVSTDSQSVPAMESFFVYVTSQTDWGN